jgi:DNA-binding NarL/FixJ family response regulator
MRGLMITPGNNEKANYQAATGTAVLPVRARAGCRRVEGPTSSTPIRTVVVDDSPAVLKTLSSLLERREDVQLVGTATDGYHGLRRVRELEPDLVLTALRLEGMNGLELSRHIKARPQAPAVIMVTAKDTPECRAAARAAGADGFVGKRHLLTRLPTAIRTLFPPSSE